jgi:hypothetical protein
MDRRIAGFYQDEESFWVAELECGHQQDVRHNPPMTLRPWVNDEKSRNNDWEHFCHAIIATRNVYSWENREIAQD